MTDMAREKYGDFLLPPGIRPALFSKIIPVNGYRTMLTDDFALLGFQISASKEKIIGLIVDLMSLTGKRPDVRFEVETTSPGIIFLYVRKGIERIVLESHIYEIEEILLGNGFISINIQNRRGTTRIYLDSHKVINIFTNRPSSTVEILKRNGIPHIPKIKFIYEENGHSHLCPKELMEGFLSFAQRIEAEEER